MFETLLENIDIVRTVHILGVALGVGAATITDVFFFRFLKDFKISRMESGLMSTLTLVIWFALAILIASGAALYFQDMERLNQSSKFLTKMIIVGVIIINGITLNLFISPRLVKISSDKHIRRIAFALGAISITSWYSAFLLGMFRAVPLNFAALVSIYGTLLLLAVVASQVMERIYAKRAKGS